MPWDTIKLQYLEKVKKIRANYDNSWMSDEQKQHIHSEFDSLLSDSFKLDLEHGAITQEQYEEALRLFLGHANEEKIQNNVGQVI